MAGRAQLIFKTKRKIVALDPRTGQELWQFPYVVSQDNMIVTRLVFNDRLLTSDFDFGSRPGRSTRAPPADVYGFTAESARASGCADDVRRALEAASTAPPADFTTRQGWVLVALQSAFYQLLHPPTAEEGIVATVMSGGDTDTNAAIAGALLGAAHGRASTTFQWRRMVLTCRPLAGLPGVVRPRPKAFWPVDALELAERLLCLAPQVG